MTPGPVILSTFTEAALRTLPHAAGAEHVLAPFDPSTGRLDLEAMLDLIDEHGTGVDLILAVDDHYCLSAFATADGDRHQRLAQKMAVVIAVAGSEKVIVVGEPVLVPASDRLRPGMASVIVLLVAVICKPSML